ncbi:MAG TPA: PilZ domain-containing protein [Steroidobacteraceae bacterium]|nr:PilZ domain-containing protein [Steroidobacteraceae bacterium]
MPEPFLGDGLIFEESLPVTWTPGALADGLLLARLNTDNHQLLGAESSLDEVRVHEALKDESPALLHELQRLEYKVNILLRLTAELALRSSGLPAAERIRMSSRGLEWCGEHPAATDATGLLSIYINSALPQPLKIPSVVAGVRAIDGTHATQFRFVGMSDAVVDMLEKLIFRHHRRLIAGAKHASS